jgi:hypothetical protein
MEANELFAVVGDAGGAGYALSRASLSAFGTGTTRRPAARSGRLRGVLRGQPQVGHDRRPLPRSALPRSRSDDCAEARRTLPHGARASTRVGGDLARAARPERRRRGAPRYG